MTKGIVLLAMGHSNYGEMAHTLTASIRYSDKDTPIHLVYTASAIRGLTEEKRKLFTSMAECPREIYHHEGKNKYIRTKLFLYDLSPFDTTIVLDVDMILFKVPVSKIFDELSAVDFTMINEGYLNEESELTNKKYSFWADPEAIRVAYMDEPGFMTGKLYMNRSEFMYFKKCESNHKFFELAKQIFDSPRTFVTEFANTIPDEFAFNVAGRILHHYPHKDRYCPIFWPYMHKDKHGINKYDGYYGYSIGGRVTADDVKSTYNTIAKYYFKQMGLRGPYQLVKHQDKMNYLPERQKI
jgi:hypothetical protein